MNDGGLLSEKHVAWIDAFVERHGRKPRILHIGNIANNAYIIAKVLNRSGLDCDVLCHNYYHIMGCPEWEDADLEGEIRDQFRPEWAKVELKGFKRPEWFAQGPRYLCVRYLIARRTGRRIAGIWWWLLSHMWKATRFGLLLEVLSRLAKAVLLRVWKVRQTAAYVLGMCLGVAMFFWPSRAVGALVLAISAIGMVHLHWSSIARGLARSVNGAGPDGDLRPDLGARIADLMRQYDRCFPDRPDRLQYADVSISQPRLESWSRFFAHYDLVQGYSTDGVYPMVVGKRPYAAFEHGTIRNIPFEEDARGRLCALTYRLADITFITNCDNIRAAGRLKLDNHRFLPHPVNEDIDPGPDAAKLRTQLREELDSDFIAFHPSRQHWEARRHPDWEKGNDIFIRGFARFVAEVDPQAAAVLVEWGQTVDASKELIRSLGAEPRVRWIPPQPNVAMISYLCACDLLADQFFLGAFGSTMPKALLHGCPAMLYLDEEQHRWCFPEMPPVINARTEAEVFDGLCRLHGDPQYREDLIAAGKAWYGRYHSNRVIAETCLDAYSQALDAAEA